MLKNPNCCFDTSLENIGIVNWIISRISEQRKIIKRTIDKNHDLIPFLCVGIQQLHGRFIKTSIGNEHTQNSI